MRPNQEPGNNIPNLATQMAGLRNVHLSDLETQKAADAAADALRREAAEVSFQNYLKEYCPPDGNISPMVEKAADEVIDLLIKVLPELVVKYPHERAFTFRCLEGRDGDSRNICSSSSASASDHHMIESLQYIHMTFSKNEEGFLISNPSGVLAYTSHYYRFQHGVYGEEKTEHIWDINPEAVIASLTGKPCTCTAASVLLLSRIGERLKEEGFEEVQFAHKFDKKHVGGSGLYDWCHDHYSYEATLKFAIPES